MHEQSASRNEAERTSARSRGRCPSAPLRLLAEGQSYRAAAREVGLQSTADLKRHAQRFGLVEAHNTARSALVAREREYRTAELIDRMRQVSGEASRELLRRLREDPEAISDRDLTVMNGVALDKLAKAERWGEPDDGGSRSQDVVAKLAAMLRGGGKVTASLHLEQAQHERGEEPPGVIDVEAGRQGDG